MFRKTLTILVLIPLAASLVVASDAAPSLDKLSATEIVE